MGGVVGGLLATAGCRLASSSSCVLFSTSRGQPARASSFPAAGVTVWMRTFAEEGGEKGGGVQGDTILCAVTASPATSRE